MNIEFGFSWLGTIFLLMLFIPNSIWTKHQPMGYAAIVGNENKVLLLMERIGQVCVSASAVIVQDVPLRWNSLWSLWVFFAVLLMLIYEIWWFRYFHSPKTLRDFYQSFLNIPVPGASLPVVAFFLLAIHNHNWLLMISVIVLGIGHIKIHLDHLHEINQHD